MFPFLLWWVKPLHGLYSHEWDYVLFLIKYYNMDSLLENTIIDDVTFRKQLEKELGIISLDVDELNPNLD